MCILHHSSVVFDAALIALSQNCLKRRVSSHASLPCCSRPHAHRYTRIAGDGCRVRVVGPSARPGRAIRSPRGTPAMNVLVLGVRDGHCKAHPRWEGSRRPAGGVPETGSAGGPRRLKHPVQPDTALQRGARAEGVLMGVCGSGDGALSEPIGGARPEPPWHAPERGQNEARTRSERGQSEARARVVRNDYASAQNRPRALASNPALRAGFWPTPRLALDRAGSVALRRLVQRTAVQL